MKNAFFVIFFSLVMSGCSTMSKEECRVADWESIGYLDSSKGKRIEYFQQHVKACSKASITADFGKYEIGHAKGLSVFCTAPNAFNEASIGNDYPVQCGEDSSLRTAFAKGAQKYQLIIESRNAAQQVSLLQNEIKDLQNAYAALQAQAGIPGSDARSLFRARDTLLQSISEKELIMRYQYQRQLSLRNQANALSW